MPFKNVILQKLNILSELMPKYGHQISSLKYITSPFQVSINKYILNIAMHSSYTNKESIRSLFEHKHSVIQSLPNTSEYRINTLFPIICLFPLGKQTTDCLAQKTKNFYFSLYLLLLKKRPCIFPDSYTTVANLSKDNCKQKEKQNKTKF